MYKPKFNSVLVEIDDKDAQWGSGNDESMLGKSYSKGKVVERSPEIFPFGNTRGLMGEALPAVRDDIDAFVGKDILWNEGAEAGTLFEEDGKLYGFIYWWDIRGVRE